MGSGEGAFVLPATRAARQLLRLFLTPRVAEENGLGLLLRDAYETQTVHEAILALISEALSDGSQRTQLARESIERCNIRGESSKLAARAMCVSTRSFFRLRAEAINVIAETLERVLKRTVEPPYFELTLARTIATQHPRAALEIYHHAEARVERMDAGTGEVAFDIVTATVWSGLEPTKEQLKSCQGPWQAMALAEIGRNAMALGRQDMWLETRAKLVKILDRNNTSDYRQAAFVLASLDRIDSRRVGDPEGAAETCARLRQLAGNDPVRVALSMVAQAEQSCIEGDTTSAAMTLAETERVTALTASPGLIARCALAQATLSFMYERYAEAIAFASAASTVMPGVEAGFSIRADSLAGRAALIAGLEWPSTLQIPRRYHRVWTFAEHRAVEARHAMDDDLVKARDLASEAIAIAADQRAQGALAYANATMAQILRLEGPDKEADKLSLSAWKTALSLRDHSLLFDLFVASGRQAIMATWWFATDEFYDALTDAFYGFLGRSPGRGTWLRPYLESVIRESLESALGVSASADTSDADSTANVLRNARVTGTAFAEFVGDGSERLLAYLPYIVRPDSRQQFRRRFRERWSNLVDSMNER